MILNTLIIDAMLTIPAGSDTLISPSRVTALKESLPLSMIPAPVSFLRDGIESLILDNANRNIPSQIGFLEISDNELPVASDFRIASWGAALFHESAFTFGKWRLSAGVRLDYEGTGPIAWNETGTRSEPWHITLEGRISLKMAKCDLYLEGTNLTGTRAGAFYFKSVGTEFLALSRPRSIIAGIIINF